MSTPSEPHADTQPLESPSDRTVKRVLYPTDFSESARAGLRYATALARDMNAVLIIAHIEEPMETYAGGQFYGPDVEIREQLKKTLEAVVPSDQTVAYAHRYETEARGAAAGILSIAKAENVNLIVMGTHGRTGLRHVLLGSVTEKVVREAPCPALTFTPGALAHELEKGE